MKLALDISAGASGRQLRRQGLCCHLVGRPVSTMPEPLQVPHRHLGPAQRQALGRNGDTMKAGDKRRPTSASFCVCIPPRPPPVTFNTEAPRHPPCVALSSSRVCPHPSSKHLPAPSVSWHQLLPWLQPSVLGQLPTCCSRPGTSWASLSRLQEGHHGGARL